MPPKPPFFIFENKVLRSIRLFGLIFGLHNDSSELTTTLHLFQIVLFTVKLLATMQRIFSLRIIFPVWGRCSSPYACTANIKLKSVFVIHSSISFQLSSYLSVSRIAGVARRACLRLKAHKIFQIFLLYKVKPLFCILLGKRKKKSNFLIHHRNIDLTMPLLRILHRIRWNL